MSLPLDEAAWLLNWLEQIQPERQPGDAKRSFHIQVTDVKLPTELETRSCTRYNTTQKGLMLMSAVFDPEGAENKVSRAALEILMQTKVFREYPYELVCLEWRCVPRHQRYRTTHRIVDTAEVETISFYHNRRAGCSGDLSELELMLSTPSFIPISTSRNQNELVDNRVTTWPTGEGKGNLIPRSQSRMDQNRLVAIPLGDCDWLESRRRELVPRGTIGSEHVVRQFQAPSDMPSQEGFRADLSPEASPRPLSTGTNLQRMEHSYEIRKVRAPSLDECLERSRKIAKMLPDARSSEETRKPQYRSADRWSEASPEVIYGVSEECEISIEDLPFPDDYWTWDASVQNYYHDTTDIYGHPVKMWYPPEFRLRV
ncbi:hypothetical protein GGR51DRAFT_559849 [Nemania sp. FL0031]|nr:hypothetical protein GGR51DRAFT_559849 [Nemania sp. FL0031]